MKHHKSTSWSQKTIKINQELKRQVRGGEAIHVWLARFVEWHSRSSSLAGSLSRKELERMGRFKSTEMAERYAIGHGLLRILLGNYLDIHPNEVEFTTNPHGKPELSCQATEGLTFNLAHNSEFILIGFSFKKQIGIDIEEILPGPVSLQEVHRVLSKEEIASWEQLPETEQAASFIQTWVRKEAVLKALGIGLGIEPDTFSVGFAPFTPLLRIGTELLSIKDLPVNKSTRAAIALVDESMPKVNCFQVVG